MLLGLRVENHRSLRDGQVFDLRPIYNKSLDAVPVAALYGANASGKSNLIDAMIFIHDGVTNQNTEWSRGSETPRSPFMLDRASRENPSKYAVDLLIDETEYTYGFAIDDKHVIEEWLYRYPHPRRKKVVLFERHESSYSWGDEISQAHGEVLEDLTPPNMLLLSIVARGRYPELRKVSDWFRNKFWYANEHNESIGMSFSQRMLETSEGVHRLVKILKEADLGISGVQLKVSEHQVSDKSGESAEENIIEFTSASGNVIRVQVTGENVGKVTSQVLAFGMHSMLFTHSGEVAADIPFADESRGTRTWFALVGLAIEALDKGWTLAIDELDTSLHPVLTTHLIRLFQDPKVNSRGAQLIFTTHDASLLGRQAGSEILRRDEVWFVEKDHTTGASQIYPLTDFRPRDGLNWERRYLGGSLGAVPFIDSDAFASSVAMPKDGNG